VAVATPYCARCGEEPVPPRDLTFRGLVEKVFHAVTSVDARTLRTAWTLVSRPGQLTVAWVAGVRRAYVAPFQLFLLANVLFFALQWLTGENVFSSTLDSHLHHQDWSALAQSMLDARVAAKPTDLASYAPVFDRAVALHAKSLILLMTAPFALLLPLVFLRERRPFMTHVVFSVHFYTFLLLVFCVALLVGKASALLGFGGIEAPAVDTVLTIAILVACTAYLYVAIGPAYGAKGAARWIEAILLAFAVGAIVLAYRFALFVITLYTT
jgi:hypothetical protein